MKAILIRRHGGPDVLEIAELPEPQPGPGEVKVRTRASALNHMDVWVRNGIPGVGALPLVLGCDASGTVESVGEGVDQFAPGERVALFPLFSCGRCGPCAEGKVNLCREFKIPGEHVDGTHRQFFCVPAGHLVKIPATLPFAQAAAFPLAYLTAWHMVVTNGKAAPGKDALVVAAASGVGSAAVQIAKRFGMRVIATASGADRLSRVKELGADFVIDHYAESLSGRIKDITGRKGVELIIEHVGEKVWGECLKSLAWGGRLVTCGATSGPVVTIDLRHLFIKQQRIIGSTMGTHAEFAELAKLVGEESLRPVVDKIFPYTEVRAAHERLEKSGHFGKIVLSWD